MLKLPGSQLVDRWHAILWNGDARANTQLATRSLEAVSRGEPIHLAYKIKDTPPRTTGAPPLA